MKSRAQDTLTPNVSGSGCPFFKHLAGDITSKGSLHPFHQQHKAGHAPGAPLPPPGLRHTPQQAEGQVKNPPSGCWGHMEGEDAQTRGWRWPPGEPEPVLPTLQGPQARQTSKGTCVRPSPACDTQLETAKYPPHLTWATKPHHTAVNCVSHSHMTKDAPWK